MHVCIMVGSIFMHVLIIYMYTTRACVPSVCAGELPWHLAPAGKANCDSGVPVKQEQCQIAASSLAAAVGRTPGRALQVKTGVQCTDPNGWGKVPFGCSVATGNDWTAHYRVKTSDSSACAPGPTAVHQPITGLDVLR